MIEMYIGLNVKYPLFLSDFNEPWIFPTDFLRMLKYDVMYIKFTYVFVSSRK